MQQIVCLSTSNWYGIPTRKQQVMGRLKDAEILYFEPSVTYIAPLKDKTASERFLLIKKKAKTDGEYHCILSTRRFALL